MLGLKQFDLQIKFPIDQQFFDMMGQCIGGHQGEIEELRLRFPCSSVNSSIVGLAPALRRLKVIKFGGRAALTLQEIRELSGIAANCDTLEEFGHNLYLRRGMTSNENFNAICQLLSKFPSLKRVTQEHFFCRGGLELHGSRFVAFLEMVKTSKTIEQVSLVQLPEEDGAAIKYHCHNNMMHNQFETIRKKGLLATTVPSSTWPVILKKFSDIPDVLFYLLQQKHGAIVGIWSRPWGS